MDKILTINEINEISQSKVPLSSQPSAFDLKLVTKRIPIRYCEYKISNLEKNMIVSESIAISNSGVLFHSNIEFSKGSLLRIWVDLPDYWSRKSRLVEYQHTSAPTFFQVLARVVGSKEHFRKQKYHILCENLNLDSIDEAILNEYLLSENGADVK